MPPHPVLRQLISSMNFEKPFLSGEKTDLLYSQKRFYALILVKLTRSALDVDQVGNHASLSQDVIAEDSWKNLIQICEENAAKEWFNFNFVTHLLFSIRAEELQLAPSYDPVESDVALSTPTTKKYGKEKFAIERKLFYHRYTPHPKGKALSTEQLQWISEFEKNAAELNETTLPSFLGRYQPLLTLENKVFEFMKQTIFSEQMSDKIKEEMVVTFIQAELNSQYLTEEFAIKLAKLIQCRKNNYLVRQCTYFLGDFPTGTWNKEVADYLLQNKDNLFSEHLSFIFDAVTLHDPSNPVLFEMVFEQLRDEIRNNFFKQDEVVMW